MASFISCVCVSDCLEGRIANSINVLGLGTGICVRLMHGESGIMQDVCVIFLIGYVMYVLGAIGGGDVKAFTAVGALTGLNYGLKVMLLSCICVIIMGLIKKRRQRSMWTKVPFGIGMPVAHLLTIMMGGL